MAPTTGLYTIEVHAYDRSQTGTFVLDVTESAPGGGGAGAGSGTGGTGGGGCLVVDGRPMQGTATPVAPAHFCFQVRPQGKGQAFLSESGAFASPLKPHRLFRAVAPRPRRGRRTTSRRR